MEKEIVEGKIGSAGDYGIKFSGSKLVAQAELGGGVGPLQAKAVVSIELDAIDVAMASIDYVCEKIPGQMDEVLGAAIKAQLLKLKGA